MAFAVGIPVLTQSTFPESPTVLTTRLFDLIENLPEGSPILLSLDYEQSSAPESSLMTIAILRHCCLKKHRMYLMTLWPEGCR